MKNDDMGRFRMRSDAKTGMLFCALAFLLSFSVSSCNFFNWLPQTTTTTTTTVPPTVRPQGSGSSIASNRNYFYRIGGLDDAGLASAAVRMASLATIDTGISWKDTASLPRGLCHASVFSAGNLVYVLGGTDRDGIISSSIKYTLVNSDGALGFGSDKRWESNVRSLPEGRAKAAWVFHDGWIFLIGGETPSGASDSIIRARLYQDGQIGQWYTSKVRLPDARWGSAAAILGERLFVAGGADARGVKRDVVSFALGEYGSLRDRRIESSLPVALQGMVLVADGEDLLLSGGYGSEAGSDKVYRYRAGSWTDAGLGADAEGPSFVRAGHSMYYLKQAKTLNAEVEKLSGLSLAPEAPIVIPGSGMVPNNSSISVGAGPGLKVRYRLDGTQPDSTDPEYPGTAIRISSTALPAMRMSLAAFSADGASSPVVYRSYRIRTDGMFFTINDTLAVRESTATGLERRVLQESGAAEPIPVSALWYRFAISAAGSYRLAWADSDEDPSCSARIKVSLYEKDLYTELPDQDDRPIYDRRNGMASPLTVSINPGEYYINIQELDGVSKGRSFAILIREE